MHEFVDQSLGIVLIVLRGSFSAISCDSFILPYIAVYTSAYSVSSIYKRNPESRYRANTTNLKCDIPTAKHCATQEALAASEAQQHKTQRRISKLKELTHNLTIIDDHNSNRELETRDACAGCADSKQYQANADNGETSAITVSPNLYDLTAVRISMLLVVIQCNEEKRHEYLKISCELYS